VTKPDPFGALTSTTWHHGVGMLRPTAISAEKMIANSITADRIGGSTLTREMLEDAIEALHAPEPDPLDPYPIDIFTRERVQVWVEKRMVGYLDCQTRRRGGAVEIRDDYGIMRPAFIRRAELSKFELKSSGDEFRRIADFCTRNNVSPDFERTDDHRNDAIIFTWKTIKVSLDEYEMLFDLEGFEPA
jgi:hypothetical protein